MMGLLELASNNSVWRGLDYFNQKKVLSWEKIEEGIYDGVVAGSGRKTYKVHIDEQHPRKSSCNCPFAEGRRVICKHMIALFFTAEPEIAEDFLRKVEAYEAEEEERERRRYEKIREYVYHLSKEELQQMVLNMLMEEEQDYY